MCKVTLDEMEALLGRYRGRYTSVVGFQPTGWAHARTAKKGGGGARAGRRRLQHGTVVLYQVSCELSEVE